MPISTATQNALWQCAPLSNPAFDGIVSVQGLILYGLNNPGTLFEGGVMQHYSSLNFDISSNLNGPSDSETKDILDKTSIYLMQETFCLGVMNFSAGVNDLTSSMVGLGNVNNTSDASKPVSTAQQAALDLKATSADVVFWYNSVVDFKS